MENKYLYAVNILLNSSATTVYITDNEEKATKKSVELLKNDPADDKTTTKVWIDCIPIENCEIGL